MALGWHCARALTECTGGAGTSGSMCFNGVEGGNSNGCVKALMLGCDSPGDGVRKIGGVIVDVGGVVRGGF